MIFVNYESILSKFYQISNAWRNADKEKKTSAISQRIKK